MLARLDIGDMLAELDGGIGAISSPASSSGGGGDILMGGMTGAKLMSESSGAGSGSATPAAGYSALFKSTLYYIIGYEWKSWVL